MSILHLDLKPVGDDYAEFRYFWDNPNNYHSRELPLSEISELIKNAESDYYTIRPEDYVKTGQALYHWLDGSDRILEQAIEENGGSEIVLAITTAERLAHLPWEVLHNGDEFLVERIPAIIPVRWKTNRSGQKLTWDEQKKNRALNVLFMATSPLGIKPVLDFEAEEGRILEATKRIPLSLTVEESGCLEELGTLVQVYDKGYFDILHLVGHATFEDKKLKHCFITETELGDPEYTSAEEIAQKLRTRMPKIIFLSGCGTGFRRDRGTLPSMAEVLLKKGATAVLSWGNNVRDSDAIEAAAKLYNSLSAGYTLPEAIAQTYQKLIEIRARDWHLLRLYVAKKLPGALVTALNEPGRKPAPLPTATNKFLDSQEKVRVATRETFIGRRRQLQNCLRELRNLQQDKIGVLIHGMGGLGKSTIASRLCDRLSEHKKIVWYRQIDEPSLIDQLANLIKNPEERAAFREDNNELKYRLQDALSKLNKLVLVFDDFEWNLEPGDEGYVLKSDVVPVLKALVWAIKNQENITRHRIIITCRYDFKSDILENFYEQPLEGLRKADLQKKLKKLQNFQYGKDDNEKELIVERALELADGNPRLLEWLNDEVLLGENVDSELSKYEESSELWKDKIIWLKEGDPKLRIDASVKEIVNQCLVFKIPVPIQALEAVCNSISDYKKQLERAIELGLIEVSAEAEESKRVYRVSRILPRIIPTIQRPEEPYVYKLYQKAYKILHELWGNKENESREKWQEIFRLKFATNKENPQRFRQGFSEMLAVQYNPKADQAFETELRKCRDDLVKDGLCKALESYLQQQQWKEADEETAWIFYQVMVKENYKDWQDLCANFPCETLREIDRLWVLRSNKKFGISIQREIYQENGEDLDKFGDRTGWRVKGNWLSYDKIISTLITQADMTHGEAQPAEEAPPTGGVVLPILIYTLKAVFRFYYLILDSLFSREKTCKV